MKKGLILHLLFLANTAWLCAQSTADSLAALLPGMAERRQADFINKHFYTFYSNNYDQAVALCEQALAISKKLDLPLPRALALKNLGVVHYLKGNYEKALEFYQQSLDLYESQGHLVGQGDVLREMANYFKKTGQHDKALDNLEKALGLCTTAKDTNCITSTLDIRGVVFLELGELEQAETNFTKELALLERNGNELGLGYALNNLAAVASARGNYERAIQLLDRSTAIRQRSGDGHGVAINVTNIGETLLQAGQPARALPYFEQALAKSETIGFNDLRRHVMQMLSDSHSALGDHALAMQWLQRSYALKDTLFNQERSRQLAEMATKYETEKKEKELARQEAKLQRRNNFLLLAGLLLAVLPVIFIFILRQQKQKRREAELQAGLATSEAANRLQGERLRISRDLHDNLGAELTIIGSTLSRKAFLAGSEAEKQELEAIGDNARQAMGQLRETVWAISHEQFSVKQLADKISDFAVRATPIPIEIEVPEIGPMLSPSQTLNLYRIAQEAITNAVKYAAASRIKVVFEDGPGGQLKLTVSDDGKGFDPAIRPAGNGLVNMRARAEELGGAFGFKSSQMGGTAIEVAMPVFFR